MYPAVGEISMPMPTVPIINIGPELEVKEQILCASARDSNPRSYRSEVTFAPSGYPEIMLIKNT